MEYKSIPKINGLPAKFFYKSNNDIFINNRMRVYSLTIYTVSVLIFFNPNILDDYVIRLINQRLLDALIIICKTKQILMEVLMKKYIEVLKILNEAMYMMDPRMSLNLNKVENSLVKHIIMHSTVMCKTKSNFNLMKVYYYYASNSNYNNTKCNLTNNNKLRNKLLYNEVNIKSEKYKISKINKSNFNFNKGMDNFYLKMKSARERSFILGENNKPNMDKLNIINFNYESLQAIDSFPHYKKSILIDDSIKTSLNKEKKDNLNNISSNENNKSNGVLNDKTSSMNSSSNNINSFDDLIVFDLNKLSTSSTDIIKENTNILANSNSKDAIINNNFKDIDLISFDFTKSFDYSNNANVISHKISTNINDLINSNFLYSKLENNNLYDLDNKYSINNHNHNDETKMHDNENNKYGSICSENFIKNKQHFFNNCQTNNLQSTMDLTPRKRNTDFILTNDLPNEESILAIDESFRRNSLNNPISNLYSMDFSKFYKPVLNSQREDVFDPVTINNYIKGYITEKGIVKYNKGKFEELNFRGQISLEIKPGFEIKNKIISMKIQNEKWNDKKSFKINLVNKDNIELVNEDPTNMRLFCKNIKDSIKLVNYIVNYQNIESVVEIKLKKEFCATQSKYKLEILFILNKKFINKIKECELSVEICIHKDNNFEISKINVKDYLINEDKSKIIITHKNYCSQENFGIGVIFKTTEENLVDVIKLKYSYKDFIPSMLSLNFTYLDSQRKNNHLCINKRSIIEAEYYI